MKKLTAALSRSLTARLLSGALFIIAGTQVAQAQCAQYTAYIDPWGYVRWCVLAATDGKNCLYKCSYSSPAPIAENVPG